jgi:hypothetical protein
MTDQEIHEGIKKYFSIEELVDKATFTKYGDKCWQFMCPRLLETLIILREGLGKSMTINSWKNGGSQQQRGLRTNTCSIVSKKTAANKLYLSAHVLGKAVDITVSGMEAEDARMWIKANADLFPHKIRLEHNMKGKPISWLHLDVYSLPSNPHIYLFDV